MPGLETATYINQLNPLNPSDTLDYVSSGDDHLRLIKSSVLNSFPRISGPLTVSQDDLTNVNYLVDTGSANNIVVGSNPAWSAYTAGKGCLVKVLATNTGATTLNVNGLGSIAVKTQNGKALIGGELIAGSIYSLTYDGTSFLATGLYSHITTTTLPFTPYTGQDVIVKNNGTGSITFNTNAHNNIVLNSDGSTLIDTLVLNNTPQMPTPLPGYQYINFGTIFSSTEATGLSNGTVGYQYINFATLTASTEATGLANNSTTYTATFTIDGVAKAISIVGSAAQTYDALITEINTDLGSSGIAVLSVANNRIEIRSATYGTSSTVSLAGGTLLPAITKYSSLATAVGGTVATTYTATFTIDGVAKAISIVGSAAQTYDALITEINTDLGSSGIASFDLMFNRIKVQSSTTGITSVVSLAAGTLLPALTKYSSLATAVAGTTGTHFLDQTQYTALSTSLLTGYAPIKNPTFIGTVAVPSSAITLNNTQVPTTADVLSYSAPIVSPTFTGTPAAPTAATATNTTQIATTAFVKNVLAANTGLPQAVFEFLGQGIVGSTYIGATSGDIYAIGGAVNGFGVSGVYKTTTGTYTITLSSAMANLHYKVFATCLTDSNAGNATTGSTTTLACATLDNLSTTSAFVLRCFNAAGALCNPVKVYVQVYA